MNNIKTILVATTALITSHAHAELALKETDTGRQVYAGIQFGMGDLSAGGFQDSIAARSTRDMYDRLKGYGFHDLKGWEFTNNEWSRRILKAPQVDVSRFGRSSSSSSDGFNGRVFAGSRLGDKFGIELGMFKTKSLTTNNKFHNNGLVNLKYDKPGVNPDDIIDGIEDGTIDHQGVYACVKDYDSIENYGCAGTTKVTTDAKGIDLVGSYDLLTVLSLRGGIHSSSVTSSIKQYSSASVNRSHPDYNNPDGLNTISATETHTGFGPVMGVALKYKGVSVDLTRHQDLGGVDVHSNTFNVGYTYSFGK